MMRMAGMPLASIMLLLSVSSWTSAQSTAPQTQQDLVLLHSQAAAAYESRDLSKAIELSKTLSDLATRLGDSGEMAFAQWNAGRAYSVKADFPQALDYFQ